MRVAEILKQEGYVADVRETETDDDGHKRFEIVLKYGRGAKSAIDGLRRISKGIESSSRPSKSLPYAWQQTISCGHEYYHFGLRI